MKIKNLQNTKLLRWIPWIIYSKFECYKSKIKFTTKKKKKNYKIRKIELQIQFDAQVCLLNNRTLQMKDVFGGYFI